jgi:hypothetical protein
MSSLANPGATCFGLRQRARRGRRESRSCLRSPASLSSRRGVPVPGLGGGGNSLGSYPHCPRRTRPVVKRPLSGAERRERVWACLAPGRFGADCRHLSGEVVIAHSRPRGTGGRETGGWGLPSFRVLAETPRASAGRPTELRRARRTTVRGRRPRRPNLSGDAGGCLAD